MGVKRCAWGPCNADTRYPDRYPGIVFFPFIKPKRNRERCLAWIKACGDKLSIDKINKYTYVCSRHFVNGYPSKEYPDPIPVSNCIRNSPEGKSFGPSSRKRLASDLEAQQVTKNTQREETKSGIVHTNRMLKKHVVPTVFSWTPHVSGLAVDGSIRQRNSNELKASSRGPKTETDHNYGSIAHESAIANANDNEMGNMLSEISQDADEQVDFKINDLSALSEETISVDSDSDDSLPEILVNRRPASTSNDVNKEKNTLDQDKDKKLAQDSLINKLTTKDISSKEIIEHKHDESITGNKESIIPDVDLTADEAYRSELRKISLDEHGTFMADFNPQRSNREMRKIKKRTISKKNRKNRLFDEEGILLGSKLDLCDCLKNDCPGCHFPCSKCGSHKCGTDCRCERRYIVDYIEVEGTNIIYNFPH